MDRTGYDCSGFVFWCLLFFLISTLVHPGIYVLMAAPPHTFWLNKLQGIIIKQQRWKRRFSLFISMCVAGVIYGKRYRANESYCEFRFYFVLTLAFVKSGEVNVRTFAIRNRNPSYGYNLCCCCFCYCCCLCGLIIILNSTGYFSHP